MPLVINNELLKGELNQHLSKKNKVLSDVRLTERVLLEACPYIEERLCDPKYLKQFTWLGKQAFYNDEPGGVKETRGAFYSTGNVGNHLIKQFRVTVNVGTAGYGGFVIHNDKTVYGREGHSYNLFDLLYNGFSSYMQPEPMRKYKRISTEELWQMNWQQRRAWKHGQRMFQQPPMTFYYRYASRWFYNKTKREGMSSSLNTKFKRYIYGAIEYGIQMAIQNIIESGEGTETMKRVWEDIHGR